MRIKNFGSHHPDAYRSLQETQTEPEGAQPERPAAPAPAASTEPSPPQQNHQHNLEQAEARGRHLVEQAEARTRQPVPGHCGETVARDSGKKAAYPQDEALIRRFCEGADAGASNASTVRFYRWHLVSISDYLRQRQLPAMSARLFSPELDNDVKQHDRDSNSHYGPAILAHLRNIESSKHGVTTIPTYKSMGLLTDRWLIEQAFYKDNNKKTVTSYESILRALSEWLAANGKPGLCDPDYLHSDQLTADNLEFSRSQRRQNCITPLKHLRSFDRVGKVKLGKYRNTSSLPAADRVLITRYQKMAEDTLILKAAASGKKIIRHPKGITSVNQYTSILRSFSAWLHQKNKGTLASLLHTPLLDSYKDSWARDKSAVYKGKAAYLLKQLRDMPVPDSSQPAAAGRQSSLALPDSAWSGWRWDPDTPQEVTGPVRRTQPAASDSVFGDLSSLNSLSYQGVSGPAAQQEVTGPVRQPQPALSDPVFGDLSSLNSLSYQQLSGPTAQQEVTGPARQPQPALSDSVFGDLSSLNSLSYQGVSGPAAQQEVTGPVRQPQPALSDPVFGDLSSLNSLSYQEVSGPAAQQDIMAVDSYSSAPRAAGVAQRLASDPWLRDNDLVGYTRHIAAQLQGQPRADLLHFVDPQQVRLLTEGNQRLRNQVLARLTGPATPPILLMPVNHNNQHWSLLCVNQQSGQAFHYDSMVSPETAHLATHTAQFRAASRVAGVVGVVGAPAPMPIARQPDTQSCGDHVLSGMEVLAHRTVSGEIFQPGGLDLRAVRPNREHIIAVLTRSGAI